MNIIISTTTGWNCGDDYIRQGVLSIMNIDLDRCNLIYWDRRPDSARTHGNDQQAMLDLADAVIIAGTPEWLGKTSELYKLASAKGLPIALVGVGMDGAPRGDFEDVAFANAAKHVKFAMARDEVALKKLKALGVTNAFIGPDPAFLAPYQVPDDEFHTICWRHLWRGVDLNPPLPKFDYAIDRENGTLRAMIDSLEGLGVAVRVVVHDHREKFGACIALLRDASFFSDPACMRYSNVYSISHRIHGLIPTLAMGGAGCIRYCNRKAQVLRHSIDCLSEYDKGWSGTLGIQSLMSGGIPEPYLDAKGLGDERAEDSLMACRRDLSDRVAISEFRQFMI